MSPEERRLLEEVVELSRENHALLKKMRSHVRWARAFSVLKWLIVIGSTVGAYYYLQPWLESLLKTLNAVPGAAELFKNFGR